jgi:hypothetical protein
MTRHIVDQDQRHSETSLRSVYYTRRERASLPSKSSVNAQREARTRGENARLKAFTKIERAAK